MHIEVKTAGLNPSEFTVGVLKKVTGIEVYQQSNKWFKARGVGEKAIANTISITESGMNLLLPLTWPFIIEGIVGKQKAEELSLRTTASIGLRAIPDGISSVGLLGLAHYIGPARAAEIKILYNICAAVLLQSIATINNKKQ